jgi:sulfide:quinone oxidoreductase
VDDTARELRLVHQVARDGGAARLGVAAARVRAGVDDRGRGARTWAAGDGVVSPVKFGGLATHQARLAAAAIARLAGVDDAPDPGEPVLHGRLLVGDGRTRRLAGRGDAEGAPLWWPAGKVAGEHLPRWLAENGVAPQGAHEPPQQQGITIRRPLRDMHGPEARYLHELARQFRSGDPAIVALGRRMHQTRQR